MQLPKWLSRRSSKDTADGLGIRGAGASSKADFGEAITEADLLFAVKREPQKQTMQQSKARWLISSGNYRSKESKKDQSKLTIDISNV